MMEPNRYYDYGQEFVINNNGIYYPAYMPLKELQRFANHFVHHIILEVQYVEVKIVQITDGKGLEWEISEYTEEPGNKKVVWLSRRYTFSIEPSWKVNSYHDHWYSMGVKERCQRDEFMDAELQKLIIKLLDGIKTESWPISYFPRIDKYLKNRNWTNILSLGKRSFREQTAKKDNLTKGALEFAKRKRKIREAK